MDELAALKLLLEWGADEALEAAPVNRFAAPRGAPHPAPATALPEASVAAAPVALPARGTAASRAAAAAAAAPTLAALRAALDGFGDCGLRETATSLVFADGDPASRLLLIGDPPGADEDRGGRPFAGEAGALLDRMLASVGLARDRALLAPLIPWRPPGGRPPTETELALCLPFLRRLIALAAPRRIVLLGTLPARALLATGRRRARPGWAEIAIEGLAKPVAALPIASPAALLADPAMRRQAWADLRLLRRALDADLAES